MSKVKPLPSFRSEKKEREFWEAKGSDARAYFDASTMVVAKFKNLTPSGTSLPLWLKDKLLDGIRQRPSKLAGILNH